MKLILQLVLQMDETLQVNGVAHYLRFEVLTLLEQSRSLMNYYSRPDDVTAHIAKIDACTVTITTHRVAHDHSLWDILLEELNVCKHSLENRHTAYGDTPQIMTQHAGYLGRMRGLAATVSQTPSGGEGCGDPSSGVPPALALGRTFSNYAQRQISSQLCATVSSRGRGGGDPVAPLSPLPSSITGSPPTPRPRSPLLRQVACTLGPTASLSDNDD